VGWAEAEMQTLDLGDPRRNRRVIRIIEQFAANPGASIPKACETSADMKATYRALSAEEVRADEIRTAHARATIERTRGLKRVLLLQDTSSADFSTRPGIAGLGTLENRRLRGFLLHSGLVVTPEGLPLGILHQDVWSRPEEELGKKNTRRARPTEEKESFRWLEMVDAAESLLPLDLEVWVIGDREADIYDLFAMLRRPSLELVVRVTQNRKVESADGTSLYEAVERAPVLGKVKIAVPRSRKRKGRKAKLEVRACSLKLEPPLHHLDRKECPNVAVSVVHVREKGTTPEGEEPIDWMIITTLPVRNLAEALEIIEAYAQRWKVERYHYVLKSGCRLEDLQLESADRIERALAIYNVVAWRLLYTTYVARLEPDLPCTAVLEEDEWQALFIVGAARALPQKPPSVREAVRMIARLGGFLGRKGDGEPGVQVLWTGLRRLMDFTLAFRRLRVWQGLVGNG
jgi:Transposase Tn5 dimerisation domain/Transposase DNA-binding